MMRLASPTPVMTAGDNDSSEKATSCAAQGVLMNTLDQVVLALGGGSSGSVWEMSLVDELNKLRDHPSRYAAIFEQKATVGAPYVAPYQRSARVEAIVNHLLEGGLRIEHTTSKTLALTQPTGSPGVATAPHGSSFSAAVSGGKLLGVSSVRGDAATGDRPKKDGRGTPLSAGVRAASAKAVIVDVPPLVLPTGKAVEGVVCDVAAPLGDTAARAGDESSMAAESAAPRGDANATCLAGIRATSSHRLLRIEGTELTLPQLRHRLHILREEQQTISRIQTIIEENWKAEVQLLRSQWALEDSERAKKRKKNPTSKRNLSVAPTSTTAAGGRSSSTAGSCNIVSPSGLNGTATLPSGGLGVLSGVGSEGLEAARQSALQALEDEYNAQRAALDGALEHLAMCIAASKDGVLLIQQCLRRLRGARRADPLRYCRGLALAADDVSAIVTRRCKELSLSLANDDMSDAGTVPAQADPDLVAACSSRYGIASGTVLSCFTVVSGPAAVEQLVMQLILGIPLRSSAAQPLSRRLSPNSVFPSIRKTSCTQSLLHQAHATATLPSTLAFLSSDAVMVGCCRSRLSESTVSVTILVSSCFEELSAICEQRDLSVPSIKRLLSCLPSREFQRCSIVLRSRLGVEMEEPLSHPRILGASDQGYTVIRLRADKRRARMAATVTPLSLPPSMMAPAAEVFSSNEAASRGGPAVDFQCSSVFDETECMSSGQAYRLLRALSSLTPPPSFPLDCSGDILVQCSESDPNVVEMHVSFANILRDAGSRTPCSPLELAAGPQLFQLHLFERPAVELVSPFTYIGRIIIVAKTGTPSGDRVPWCEPMTLGRERAVGWGSGSSARVCHGMPSSASASSKVAVLSDAWRGAPRSLPSVTSEFHERGATLHSPFQGVLEAGAVYTFRISLPKGGCSRGCCGATVARHLKGEVQRLAMSAANFKYCDGRSAVELVQAMDEDLLMDVNAPRTQAGEKNPAGCAGKRTKNSIGSAAKSGGDAGAKGGKTGPHREAAGASPSGPRPASAGKEAPSKKQANSGGTNESKASGAICSQSEGSGSKNPAGSRSDSGSATSTAVQAAPPPASESFASAADGPLAADHMPDADAATESAAPRPDPVSDAKTLMDALSRQKSGVVSAQAAFQQFTSAVYDTQLTKIMQSLPKRKKTLPMGKPGSLPTNPSGSRSASPNPVAGQGLLPPSAAHIQSLLPPGNGGGKEVLRVRAALAELEAQRKRHVDYITQLESNVKVLEQSLASLQTDHQWLSSQQFRCTQALLDLDGVYGVGEVVTIDGTVASSQPREPAVWLQFGECAVNRPHHVPPRGAVASAVTSWRAAAADDDVVRGTAASFTATGGAAEGRCYTTSLHPKAGRVLLRSDAVEPSHFAVSSQIPSMWSGPVVLFVNDVACVTWWVAPPAAPGR